MATHAERTEPADLSIFDRRREERFVTTYRVARILTEQGCEQLCIIRNVSSSGLAIETRGALAIGERLFIEPRACRPMSGSVRWSDGHNHGITFDVALSPGRLGILTASDTPHHHSRAPRITVNRDAMLLVAGHWQKIHLWDISQGGAKLECASSLAPGDPVLLSITGLAKASAFVRWQRDKNVGLIFAAPFSIEDLSAWIETTLRERGTPNQPHRAHAAPERVHGLLDDQAISPPRGRA